MKAQETLEKLFLKLKSLLFSKIYKKTSTSFHRKGKQLSFFMIFILFTLLSINPVYSQNLESYISHLKKFKGSFSTTGTISLDHHDSIPTTCRIRYIDLSQTNPMAYGLFAGIEAGEQSIGIDLESINLKEELKIENEEALLQQHFKGYDDCLYSITFKTDTSQAFASISEHKVCSNNQESLRILTCKE